MRTDHSRRRGCSRNSDGEIGLREDRGCIGTGRSRVQGYPQLHSQFPSSLGMRDGSKDTSCKALLPEFDHQDPRDVSREGISTCCFDSHAVAFKHTYTHTHRVRERESREEALLVSLCPPGLSFSTKCCLSTLLSSNPPALGKEMPLSSLGFALHFLCRGIPGNESEAQS